MVQGYNIEKITRNYKKYKNILNILIINGHFIKIYKNYINMYFNYWLDKFYLHLNSKKKVYLFIVG